MLAFGIDGEEAVVKEQFSFAVHMRCFRHMKQSVDMGYPADAVSAITAHIFGQKDDPTFFEGLVDANSKEEFEEQLGSLKVK